MKQKQKSTQSRWQNKVEYNDRYYVKNRSRILAKSRSNYLRRAYGITETEYRGLLVSQRYSCAICCGEFDRMCVDHDHATGEIRGLLCVNCNSAIGKLRDDPILLRRATCYLTNPKRPNPKLEGEILQRTELMLG